MRAGFVAHPRASVGGDQDRRQILAQVLAHARDRGDAIAVVEVVVDQQAVRAQRTLFDGRQCRRGVAGLDHTTAPTAEQRFHAVEDRRLVIDADGNRPGELAGVRVRLHGVRQMRRRRVRQRHRDGEARAAANPGIHVDVVLQHPRDPLDDRQAETEAARDACALIEPVKFGEDGFVLALRDTDAGIEHVDAQMIAAQAAADQHATLRRVFDRIGNEVLQQAAQHAAIRADHALGRHEHQFQPLAAGDRREFHLDLPQQLVDAETRGLRPQHAGIEPRDVEQRAEDFLDRFQRSIDVADQLTVGSGAAALHEAGDIEPRRVKRLQDVVAGGGEEARLRGVGFFRVTLGARQRRVQPRQFLGAFAHAPLQRLVGFLQRLGRLDARRHVGEGGGDGTVRHAIGAYFDE